MQSLLVGLTESLLVRALFGTLSLKGHEKKSFQQD